MEGFTFNPKNLPSIEEELSRHLRIIRSAKDMAQKYGQSDLEAKANKLFNDHYQNYARMMSNM